MQGDRSGETSPEAQSEQRVKKNRVMLQNDTSISKRERM